MAIARRSRLRFAVIGLIMTIAASSIPYIGILVCAPLTVACVGFGAGYVGARTEPTRSPLEGSVIASAVAGGGALFGSMLFMLLLLGLLYADPTVFHSIILAYYASTNEQLSVEQLQSVVAMYGPMSGLCYGVLNLVIAIAFGLLGGWGAARRSRKESMKLVAQKSHTFSMRSFFKSAIYINMFFSLGYLTLVVIPAFFTVYGLQSLHNLIGAFIYEFWYTAISVVIVVYIWLISPFWSLCLMVWLFVRPRFTASRERVFWMSISILSILIIPLTYRLVAQFANRLD